MRIGIFDSGLGGLVIAKEIFKRLPKYDYVYLGDTKHLPYGNKGQKKVLNLTQNALKYLFKKDCGLVIIACNTASAEALRKIQREFLPKSYPDKKVLGVIVPTIESVVDHGGQVKKIGILATKSTATSHAYKKEIAKVNPKLAVYEQAAPRLVPFIESNQIGKAKASLKKYLKPLLRKNINVLVLGCTHYPLLKEQAISELDNQVSIISQEKIIPDKLENYLKRHPEVEVGLSKNGKKEFLITKTTPNFKKAAQTLFKKSINLKLAEY